MSVLSDKIEELIDESGQTISEIAERGGISRTTLHKVKSGRRLPNRLMLKQLAKALSLSPPEEDLLMDFYASEIIGETRLKNWKKIKEIIEMVSELSSQRLAFTKEVIGNPQILAEDLKKNPVKKVRGKENVQMLISELIDREICLAKNPCLSLISSYDQDYVYQYLLEQMMGNQKQLRLKGIVCFPQGQEELVNEVEIKTLKSLVGVTLMDNIQFDANHTTYNKDQTGTKTPYMIVSAREVIIISIDCNKAVCYRKAEALKKYQEYFECLFEKTAQYIVESENPFDIYGLEQEYQTKHVFEPIPCFAHYFTDQLLEQKLYEELPYYEELLSASKDHYQHFRKVSTGMLNFFSLSGLEEFLRSGDFMLPEQIIKDIKPAERLQLLRMVREDLATGQRKSYLINQDKLFYNSAAEYVVNNRVVRIIFHYWKDQRYIYKTIGLKKESIYRAFDDFFTLIADSDYVFSIEETLEMIDQIITEYEQKPLYNQKEDLDQLKKLLGWENF